MDIAGYLQRLIREELDGDAARFDELWERVPNFGDRLREFDSDAAWLHWKPKTFDGIYCLRDGVRFVVYFQERGAIDDRSRKVFHSEREAVRFALNESVIPIGNAMLGAAKR